MRFPSVNFVKTPQGFRERVVSLSEDDDSSSPPAIASIESRSPAAKAGKAGAWHHLRIFPCQGSSHGGAVREAETPRRHALIIDYWPYGVWLWRHNAGTENA